MKSQFMKIHSRLEKHSEHLLSHSQMDSNAYRINQLLRDALYIHLLVNIMNFHGIKYHLHAFQVSLDCLL